MQGQSKMASQSSKRVLNRFKWMVVACLLGTSVNYLVDRVTQSVQEFTFVDAGNISTYEGDQELIDGYIESAKA